MLVTISVYSILPAFVFAIFKFAKHPEFRPFFYLVFLGALTDIGTKIVWHFHPEFNNLGIINIFILLQFYLIIFQLYKWKFLKRESFTGYTALALITIGWVYETWHRNFNGSIDKYSLIFSAFFIVIFITVFINRLVFEKITNLLKDPRFLISIGILVYFTIVVFVYSFLEPGRHSDPFTNDLWYIHNYFNIFTNLIYAYGLICLPQN